MTPSSELDSNAQAARVALLVHAELVGDAIGGELNISERDALSGLLADARHLADAAGIGWEALLVVANALHRAETARAKR